MNVVFVVEGDAHHPQDCKKDCDKEPHHKDPAGCHDKDPHHGGAPCGHEKPADCKKECEKKCHSEGHKSGGK